MMKSKSEQSQPEHTMTTEGTSRTRMLQRPQSVVKTANLERFRRMLTDLADAGGIIRDGSLDRLANEFNARYAEETKPITYATIHSYIAESIAAGWLASRRKPGIFKRLILTLLPK